MHINLKHLRLFWAVAEAGSVSGGAQRLHISQPAVTRQLKELEGRLDTALLHRMPRGVKLTETGELLFEYAQRIFALASEAEKTIAEIEDLEGGELLLGASTTIGNYVLADILAIFHHRYPKVRVSLEIANTDQIELLVQSWNITLGLVEGPPHSQQLSKEIFMHDELLPVVRRDHPIARQKHTKGSVRLDTPVLLREQGSGTRQVVESHLHDLGVQISHRVYIGGTEAIKRLVTSGMGVAWLPKSSITRELTDRSLEILPVPAWVIQRPWFRLQRRDSRLPRAARVFIDLLDEAVD